MDFRFHASYQNFLTSFVTPERLTKIDTLLRNRTKHITVVLEDVYQLHNSSAVIRSCEVFGVQEMHVIEQKYGKRIDKEIALGAQKWTDIHRHNTTLQAINEVRTKGYKIVATLPGNDALHYKDLPLHEPVALFFGTERQGISDVIKNQADYAIQIPMYGFTDSLNISVSAGILLNYYTEYIRNAPISWQLKPDEIAALRTLWLERSIKNINSIQKVFQERILKR